MEEEVLAFPKPVKKQKKSRWGVYRNNPLPERAEWTGDPLLEPPYQGHKLDKITDDIAREVLIRSGGRCEICNAKGQEFNHIAGRNRKAHANNINHLCMKCHKVPDGFHAYKDIYNKVMKKYQDWCFAQGYTEEEVKFLLGTKDYKLF